MNRNTVLPLLIPSAVLLICGISSAETTYDADVEPIFKVKCAACHGGFLPQGGLKLNSLKNTLKGGKSGKAVIPGNAENSLMVKQFYLPMDAKTHMPPKDAPQLTSAEIATIRAWIDAGAK